MTEIGKPSNDIEIVIITGMSGAGKTVAVQSFEDLGFYCIDNLPPELLVMFLNLMMKSENQIKRIAAVMDTRGGDLFDSLIGAHDLEMQVYHHEYYSRCRR